MNKKGFTLIELLAVIVILAIIALIAVPIVLNIISDSKENATIRSAELYMDAVNLAVTNAMMDPSFPQGNVTCEMISNPPNSNVNFPLGDSRENYDNDDLLCYQEGNSTGKPVVVDITGDVPTSGTIKFSNGKMLKTEDTSLAMSDGNTYVYSNGNLVVSSSNEEDDVIGPQYYICAGGTLGTTSAPAEPSTTPPTGRNFYIGYNISNGVISKAYVCFMKNSTEYCLKGNDPNAYGANQDVITSVFNNCSLGEEYSECMGSSPGDVTIEPAGYVNIMDAQSGQYCSVTEQGTFHCY